MMFSFLLPIILSLGIGVFCKRKKLLDSGAVEALKTLVTTFSSHAGFPYVFHCVAARDGGFSGDIVVWTAVSGIAAWLYYQAFSR